MGGFLDALGAVGKTMLEKRLQDSAIGQGINAGIQRYRTKPFVPYGPPAPLGSPPSPDSSIPSDDADMGMGITPEPAAHGGIFTQPTIVKVAENHQPEAIIPLGGQGNKTHPDLLEGHLQPPKIPGLRYQRYKGFSNTAY